MCLAIVVLRVSYMFALGMGGGYSSGCGWVVVWAFRWFVCLLCCVVMVCVWSIDLGFVWFCCCFYVVGLVSGGVALVMLGVICWVDLVVIGNRNYSALVFSVVWFGLLLVYCFLCGLVDYCCVYCVCVYLFRLDLCVGM